MTYSIGQVESLTGVKAHVLRYWENVVPGFSSTKDLSGRRFYTQREVELIFRIKFLIQNKKFTAQGAGQQILEESGVVQNNSEIMQQIHEARKELTELYTKIHNSK